MTFAELDRVFESKRRTIKSQERKQAIFDYKLADLIGRSVARIHNSRNKLPSIEETYPSLFDAEEVSEAIQEKKEELSILRFRQFAQSYNKNYKEVASNK